MGPDRIRMGIVAFPRNHVDTDVVAVLNAESIIDETSDDMLLENFGWFFAA